MVRTAINLYTIRDYGESIDELLPRIADAGYDGVQFSGGLRGAAADRVRELLDATGLDAAPAHVGIERLEDDTADVVETYRTVGTDSLVVPYLDGSHFESRGAISATADRLAARRDRLAAEGLGLQYHNHDAEFTTVDGEPAFDRFLAETERLPIELDVGWVAAAGHAPVAYLERLDGRCDAVHFRDVDADGEDAELGDGIVDLDACSRAARESGAEWFIYERVDPESAPESIRHGASVLDGL